ncbi:hypothetical protein ACGFNQ_23395 [Streptomyces asoensis]|uniref:hypothetical protein n=1 Tax=Streptomyces asoensis TaxID=249586 RepID=UPI003713A126
MASLTDPFALEVHRAIVVAPVTGEPALPILPTYVPRVHDRELAESVASAVAGLHVCVMLVGGSSTGKTRACWEAVTALPSNWRLWHPIDPGRPEALLEELPSLAPRTVIWLNDAHHYLLTPSDPKGERVAARLRQLLRTPERAPVLVLGTMWPEYWSMLTSQPSAGQADPHAQARELLLNQGIRVAPAFTAHDLAKLREKALRDPRLAHALAHAENGRIAQYLAAAPALLERYGTAPDDVRALVEAAMDARRLGHGPALPARLLAEAAPGGLSDQQWDLLPDDWLESALAYAVHPVRGAQGLLTRVRARPGRAATGQAHRYRLADFIEQHGRRTRRDLRGSRELWDAVPVHAEPESLSAYGESAHRRGLLRQAMDIYTASADAGSVRAMLRASYLLLTAGRYAEAEAWLGERVPTLASTGFLPLSTDQASWLVEDLQRETDVMSWLDVRADRADLFALVLDAHLLMAVGRQPKVREWMIAYGSMPAWQALNAALTQWRRLSDVSGKLDTLRARTRAAEANALAALSALALTDSTLTSRLQSASGASALTTVERQANEAAEKCKAISWTSGAADRRSLLINSAIWGAAAVLLTISATDDAVMTAGTTMQTTALVLECGAWLQHRADTQDPEVALHAPSLLEPAAGSGAESALAWLRSASDAGDAMALHHATRLLTALDRQPEADRLRHFGWDISEGISAPWSLSSANSARHSAGLSPKM